MKKLYSFAFAMILFIYAQAQTIVFSDNFDSYPSGVSLCTSNNTDWTTWSNSPGSSEDAIVSSEQANSGSNSLKVTGYNDVIYRFSNQTSGIFDVEFDYYVPSSGNGAYFNVQHHYNPGVMWAYACYFYTDGTGYLTAGSTNYAFSMPVDAWFHVKNHIDLNANTATLTINNVDVQTWNFSFEETSTNGINQLGSINFFAGAPDNTLNGTYYVDDFVFTELSPANEGSLVITPATDINLDVNHESTTNYTIGLNNPGGTSINYRIVPVYDIPNPDATSQGNVTLTRAGAQTNGVIFTSAEYATAAIGYTSEELLTMGLIGKKLNTVEVYVSNVSFMSNAKIRVFDMGGVLVGGPGETVYEQSFTPIEGLNTITLNTPYLLDGRDVWFGIYYEQVPSETDVPAVGMDDATSPHAMGNWCKSTVAWTQISNPELTGNWCITGYVDGTAITPWMSVNPQQGTLAANTNQDVTVTFGSNDMPADVHKTGSIYILSNDINHAQTVIAVDVNFITVGIDENNSLNIAIFPNPTSNLLNIVGDNIVRVQVYTLAGQEVFDNQYESNDISVNVQDWSAGTYVVKVMGNGFSKTEKIIVK